MPPLQNLDLKPSSTKTIVYLCKPELLELANILDVETNKTLNMAQI
jgi:hypothetical protein